MLVRHIPALFIVLGAAKQNRKYLYGFSVVVHIAVRTYSFVLLSVTTFAKALRVSEIHELIDYIIKDSIMNLDKRSHSGGSGASRGFLGYSWRAPAVHASARVTLWHY